METRKLYYENPFQTAFSAQVLSCKPAGDTWQVILDRTALYPEGGGQPADHGTLGGVHVTDVHEKDGVILHTCAAPLDAGSTVEGTVDWERRFDHMQQHSGEHIVSGLICAKYHCDNVGFHLGADTVTIDFNAEISPEDLAELEARANQYICEDHPIDIQFHRGTELETLTYRSKKALEGDVRIVAFPGADCCACCGTHVRTSGQVGLIKILSCQKFREGVRIEMVCGRRAHRLLSEIYRQAQTAGRQLSVKPQELLPAVERLEAELEQARGQIAELETALFSSLAREQESRGDVLLIRPPMRPDSVRRLADAVGRTCGGLAAVFAGEPGRYTYALVRGDGQDIAPLVRTLNQALHGRGGGKKGFAQGSVETDETAIRAFFGK